MIYDPDQFVGCADNNPKLVWKGLADQLFLQHQSNILLLYSGKHRNPLQLLALLFAIIFYSSHDYCRTFLFESKIINL